MKKIKIMSFFVAMALTVTGCSLSSEKPQQATDYMSEEGTSEEASDSSEAESSIMIIKNLSEPELTESTEGSSSSEAADSATSEASNTEDDKVEMVFFGDSQIATGRDDGTDLPTLISQRVPNSIAYNIAIGGTTASVDKTTSSVSASELHSTSFLGMAYCLAGMSDRDATLANYPAVLEKMNQINPESVDYYILEYGANDFFNEVPLDVTIYESESVQAHAFYNAYCKGIDVLKSISPNAKIVIVTPFYGIYVDTDGTYIGDSYIVSNGIGTLADYAKKATNVAEDCQAISFDTMFMTKCDLYLDTASEYLMDNLHLSLKGRQVFSRLLAHQINFEEHNEPYAYMETDVIKIAEFDPDEYYRYDEGQMREYFPESWEKYIRGEFPLAQPSEEALAQYGSEAATEASN